MTKEEFEEIIKPLYFLDCKECQFIRTALLENFYKWNETKQGNMKRLSTKTILFLCGVVARLFPHKHKWQVRGRNRYSGATYRICLKCRETYKRVNNSWEDERWEICEPIAHLDAQFDNNDKFIFK